jgi:hypothetical protein
VLDADADGDAGDRGAALGIGGVVLATLRFARRK